MAAGDLTIKHTRRTRLQGGWFDDTDVPIGETREEYEYDIFESGVLLHQVKQHLTTSLVYTLAQYKLDSGNSGATQVPTGILVKIYQISERIGRGTPGEATFT